MIETQCKRHIAFKDGIVFHEGDAINVTTYVSDDTGHRNPEYATVRNLSKDITITFRQTALHKLSDEFIPVTMDDIEAATGDSVCDSITGMQVEPDGYDEHGFPSILMAVGMC